MLRFLEVADLVEQERDDIQRILSPERKSTCEFPFVVESTAAGGRPEDEAGCSYGVGGRRSSSESLRGESELCSSDTRQSPSISSNSTATVATASAMGSSDVRRRGGAYTSGGGGGGGNNRDYHSNRGSTTHHHHQQQHQHQSHYQHQQPYLDHSNSSSSRKNDSQQQQSTNGGNSIQPQHYNPAATAAQFAQYAYVPAGYPPFANQAMGIFPASAMVSPPNQWPFGMFQQAYSNPHQQQIHFVTKQMPNFHHRYTSAAANQAVSPSSMFAAGQGGPIFFAQQHQQQQQQRPSFMPNAADLSSQNIQYSLENLNLAASYTGPAIIQQEDPAVVHHMNAQHHHLHQSSISSSGDEYQQQQQQQMASASMMNEDEQQQEQQPEEEQVHSTTGHGDIIDGDLDVEDGIGKRRSCDSPTIVIGADQNAAAVASRERASVLMMNVSSSASSKNAAAPVLAQNDDDVVEEDGGISQQASTAVPSSCAADEIVVVTTAVANDHSSSAQSSRVIETGGGGNIIGPVSPTENSGMDIYYDAEDKQPAQTVSSQNPAVTIDINDSSTKANDGTTSKPIADSPAPTAAISPTIVADGTEESGGGSVTAATGASANSGKSWASLFRGTKQANEALVVNSSDDSAKKGVHFESTRPKNRSSSNSDSLSQAIVGVDQDTAALRSAEALRDVVFINRGPTFVLRGIVNRGNWCYVNATLQALMACPPFYHFLRNLSPFVPQRTNTSTPLLDAFIKFAMEFPLLDRNRSNANRPMPAVDPGYLYSIISRLKSDASFKGRQEDAEEFLLQVFNVLHDEMVSCLSLLDKDRSDPPSREQSVNGDTTTTPMATAENAEDSSEWHQVGPGRKAAVTRQTKYTQSPLSQLFLGQLRYGLSQPGAKESANLEPFYTLPLDVLSSNIKDLSGALQAFTSKETLKNFAGKNKTEVDATRRITFHEFPHVLIFQLKYFVYGEDGLKKLIKPIEYPMDLNLDRGDFTFSRKTMSSTSRQYKLFAVVFHHGEKAQGGHYTVDVFHGGQWVNMDDTKITHVNNDHVLHFQAPRVPYLLFYRRWDAESQQQQQPQQSSR